MKLVVAGSRSLRKLGEIGYRITKEGIAEAEETFGRKVTQIVSGRARGPDRFGEAWAIFRRISIKRFIPDWDRYGKRAGHIRNGEMADYGDAVLVLWDGESRGSEGMMRYCQANQIPIIVKKVDLSSYEGIIGIQ
jgi:hypothetical protein